MENYMLVEASIEKLNDKITNLEGKLAYFESQGE